jgi:multicomponent Na+:H+ antiporter subunit A
MIILDILLVIMIIAAFIAIEARDMAVSAVAVGMLGFSLAFGFLLLKSPDIAVVLLSIEILMLVIVIRTTMPRRGIARGKTAFAMQIPGAAGILVFLGLACRAARDLPAFGAASSGISDAYRVATLSANGAANIVSAVALDFRGFDALAGFSVLFMAACAVGFTLNRNTGDRK